MATPESPVRWDRQIQRRLARGEESALGELYDQFAPLVHGLAHRVLDDPDAAEQITREVFGYIWENPDAYDPGLGSMRSWIGNLTHRRAVDRLRQEHGLRPSGLPAAAGAAPDEDRAIPARLAEQVHAAATAARVQLIVGSLPRGVREAVLLAYFRGHTYEQAAAELGVSPATAKHRMRLGLQLLSTALSSAEAS
ncbi:sigma-70 family RNA polymerase sigma factor [Phaeacidiphilus oryzae]|uniref:sigma-70 family RNA polymerase sigma factor n=1 Tax=Phaeacidiphilus oryzae TaxID=348818 RepID=UPI00055F8754|nr:sigma-70 family RNA polymerase sigma factor [Phaeacidiphilus oryzae]